MSLWWRAECGSIDHPKLLKLSDAMHRAWYTLMCVAGANGGALPPTEDIAIRLRMNEAKVAEWITKLVKAELFDNIDGVFVPHNWTRRQYKSDKTDPTAAERQKRYRRNKRNGVTGVTECDDSNALRPEAEAEPKADSEQSRADAGAPIDEEFGKKLSALTVSVRLAFSTRGMPTPPLNRLTLWLQQGYAQGTILGAVDRVLKRGRAISTLDYFDAAIQEDHAKKPVSPPKAEPEIDRSNWFIIVEGTLEHTCWNIIRKEQKLPPLFLCNQIAKDGAIYERAAKCPTLFPIEFNDFGERLEPAAEEDAA
jgi:hypothetical protein